MKFYDREKELKWLGQTRKVAFENHSQMTVVTGRRRIGKTKLILKSCEGTPTVYLFIDRSNEALLCGECARNASTALGVYISPEITSFAGLFETLMEIGRNFAYNLYKISEHPSCEHYAARFALNSPTPNFHRPQDFQAVKIVP